MEIRTATPADLLRYGLCSRRLSAAVTPTFSRPKHPSKMRMITGLVAAFAAGLQYTSSASSVCIN